jgi:DNA polymerase-3 subunit beta
VPIFRNTVGEILPREYLLDCGEWINAIAFWEPEFSIAFNPEFLMAPLRNLSEDESDLDLIDDMSPGVIKIAGPFLCVLMPMRFS